MKALRINVNDLKKAIAMAESRKSSSDSDILIIAENGDLRWECHYAECVASYAGNVDCQWITYTYA